MTDFLSNLGYADAVGTLGTLIVVAAYFATQMRFINSDDLIFPALNLLGSLPIAFSLYYSFNLASVLMEFFWIAISLLGICQAFRSKKSAADRKPSQNSTL